MSAGLPRAWYVMSAQSAPVVIGDEGRGLAYEPPTPGKNGLDLESPGMQWQGAAFLNPCRGIRKRQETRGDDILRGKVGRCLHFMPAGHLNSSACGPAFSGEVLLFFFKILLI